MQPFSEVAAWHGDRLTFWGHGQDTYPARRFLGRLSGFVWIDEWLQAQPANGDIPDKSTIQ
jgi:hypothetical protein